MNSSLRTAGMFDWISAAMPIFVNHIEKYHSLTEGDSTQSQNAIDRSFYNHFLQRSGCSTGRRGGVEAALDCDHRHVSTEHALSVSG